jgi:surfactin synthase thioesterase subunit
MISPWFPSVVPRPGAALRVVCLPPAGTGASVYRALGGAWGEAPIETWPVQLPGREGRSREPLIRSLPVLLDALCDALAAVGDAPFALLGTSLGGRIAFELTRRLESTGARRPRLVILGSATEPATLSAADRTAHRLDDAAFERHIARFGALPEGLRRYPHQYQAVLAVLRGDLALLDTDELPGDPRIETPLVVLAGRQDPSIGPGALEAWRCRAIGPFTSQWLDGGHLSPIEQPAAIAAIVGGALR